MPETKSRNSFTYSRFFNRETSQILFKARKKELDAYQVSPRQAHVLTCIYELGDRANLNELAERTREILILFP